MTPAEERAAMVALLRTGRRPWVEYAALVEERGSALPVLDDELRGLNDEPTGQIHLFPKTTPAPDTTREHLLATATADLERWSAQGMRLLTVLDPEYPPNLRAVHDRPPMVFLAGRLTPADARSIAVVGTRRATPAGVRTASEIARHLTEAGYTVVSGLAAGIDTAAHTAALDSDGRTVAVIGTGLNRAYPPQNRALQDRIAEQCAVISRLWPDSSPTRQSFPMRNAVISGIALATVVVEASHTSGARMLARLARAQGRPVFLLADLVQRESWARDAARRPGTQVVRAPEEITASVGQLMTDPLVA